MSAATLLSTYAGANPATLVVESTGGGPGTAENIKQVLLNIPNAGDADQEALSNVGAFSCASITHLGAIPGTFTISGEAGHGVNVVGPVGASLVATTGGATLESTAADVTITAGADVELSFLTGNLVMKPLPADFTNVASAAAANGPTYAVANLKQLKIKIGAVDYWIVLNPAAFA